MIQWTQFQYQRLNSESETTRIQVRKTSGRVFQQSFIIKTPNKENEVYYSDINFDEYLTLLGITTENNEEVDYYFLDEDSSEIELLETMDGFIKPIQMGLGDTLRIVSKKENVYKITYWSE